MSEEEAFMLWGIEEGEEEQRKSSKESKRRCPECNSENVYPNIDKGFWVCNDWGYEWEN